jgi:asparagine synthase (glutamine-hydrolysing)
MSGILGVFHQDRRPVDKQVVRDAIATLAHRGPDARMWVKGSVGLACRLLRNTPESLFETQPFVDGTGRVLVFDGRLDNRDELVKLLRETDDVSNSSSDPALVLGAYDAFGDRFAEQLSGDFAFGLFDPARQRLLLARDALGVRPLYYCRTGETFLFASEIKALLAHPDVSARPNEDRLAEFLFLGLSGQEHSAQTFFEPIFTLLPGHMAVVTAEHVWSERYWDFDPSQRLRLGSFEEYAEVFHHLFEQSVRRRLRSAFPIVVSVSGGLDSSAIFCTAETLRRRSPENHPRIVGLSYTSTDGSPHDETRFLEEIERGYGLEILRIPDGPRGFFDRCSKEIWHSEAPSLDEHANSSYAYREAVRQQGARTLLTGHWGDQVLVGQAYLVDHFRRLDWLTIWRHLRQYARWMPDVPPRAFRRNFQADLIRYHLPESLVLTLRRMRAWFQKNRLHELVYTTALKRRARPRPWTSLCAGGSAHSRSVYKQLRSGYAPFCLEFNDKVASAHGFEMAYPFLDRDLVSFLLAIPGEMRAAGGVPKALLRHAMRGILPEVVCDRKGKGDTTHISNESMMRDFPQMETYFLSHHSAVGRGYVKREKVGEALTFAKGLLQAPDCATTWAVAELLGLELWLQTFWSDGLKGAVGSRNDCEPGAVIDKQVQMTTRQAMEVL